MEQWNGGNGGNGGTAVEGERSIAAVARDLAVRPDQLRKWKLEAIARGEVAADAGRALSAEERVRQLERDLAVVRQERDFLKKATVFFARESP